MKRGKKGEEKRKGERGRRKTASIHKARHLLNVFKNVYGGGGREKGGEREKGKKKKRKGETKEKGGRVCSLSPRLLGGRGGEEKKKKGGGKRGGGRCWFLRRHGFVASQKKKKEGRKKGEKGTDLLAGSRLSLCLPLKPKRLKEGGRGEKRGGGGKKERGKLLFLPINARLLQAGKKRKKRAWDAGMVFHLVRCSAPGERRRKGGGKGGGREERENFCPWSSPL